MKLPEPQTRTFSGLIEEIEKGQTKNPPVSVRFCLLCKFMGTDTFCPRPKLHFAGVRRNLIMRVWTIQKSAGLIDSILKGYPIGTFIFWRTKDRLRSIRNLGGRQLPEPEEGETIDYVLDGQ